MWAVFKTEPDSQIRLWYVGIHGEWTNHSGRAARWPDRRDAQFIANYVRGKVDWLEHSADKTQYVPEEPQ